MSEPALTAPPRPGANNLNLRETPTSHFVKARSSSAIFTGSTSTTSRTRASHGSSRRSCAPAVRVTYRFTATSSSCRSNSREAVSTAALAGVTGYRQRRTFPRHPHFRHQRYPKAEADSRGADVPRIAYAYAGGRSRRSAKSVRLWIGDRRESGRLRSCEGCSALNPEEDPNTALFSIDVIQVPLVGAGERAHRQSAAHLRRHGDRRHCGAVERRRPRARDAAARATNQCHDLTVFPELGLAAGACSGNGILLDISDPVNPLRLDGSSTKISPTGTQRRSTTTARR